MTQTGPQKDSDGGAPTQSRIGSTRGQNTVDNRPPSRQTRMNEFWSTPEGTERHDPRTSNNGWGDRMNRETETRTEGAQETQHYQHV
jgi:hypothetical protein